MNQMNIVGSTQPGVSLIEAVNFDENGDRLFFHEDGDEEFACDEMIAWFNIFVNDEDNINDGGISNSMFKTMRDGISLGFITDKTPKNW
jgi:hypothetical protein